MSIMEFEEMKKVWDAQNNEPIYGINEQALHNRILSKKKQANHLANLSELLCIIAYSSAGCILIALDLLNKSYNVFMYILAGWMLCSALYLLVSRMRRINGVQQFDRSMRGDLEYAITVATYQVRISRLIRWNTVPIGVLIILGVWDGGKSMWLVAGIIVFLFLANYASGWELNFYKKKKHELEILKEKLEREDMGYPGP